MDAIELEVRAEKALNYLADTDVAHAQAKAKMSLLHEMRKVIHAQGFSSLSAGAVETKRLAAYETPEYIDHLANIEKADIEYLTLNNRRQTASAITDVYRTVAPNSRKG